MTVFYRITARNIEEPDVDSLENFLTSFESANEALSQSLEITDDELADVGFVDPLCYAIGPGDAAHMVQVIWRHESGNVLARILTRLSANAASESSRSEALAEQKSLDLITPLAGRFRTGSSRHGVLLKGKRNPPR